MDKLWECPHCPAAARTVDDATPMHPCPDMAGLMVPLVVLGTKARLVVVEREDYVGGELPQYDGNGRPVTAVVTERVHGFDTTVFLPTATAGVDEVMGARDGVV